MFLLFESTESIAICTFTMDIITSTFILLAVVCLLFYILQSNNEKNSSIPYAKYQSYPVVGHLFSILRNRTKFLMECQQRYGQNSVLY